MLSQGTQCDRMSPACAICLAVLWNFPSAESENGGVYSVELRILCRVTGFEKNIFEKQQLHPPNTDDDSKSGPHNDDWQKMELNLGVKHVPQWDVCHRGIF